MQFHYPLELTAFFYPSFFYLDLLEIEPLLPYSETILPGFKSVIKSDISEFMLQLIAFQFLLDLPLHSNYLMIVEFVD
jgi:hypothetical protein